MVLDPQVQPPAEIANAITFHGKMISDVMDAGQGFCAFNMEGPNKEEMPLILIIGKQSEISSLLKNNDLIMGVGSLEKIQDEWVVLAGELHKIDQSENS